LIDEAVVQSEERKTYRRDIAHLKKYHEPPSTQLEGDSKKSEATGNKQTTPDNSDSRQQEQSTQPD